MGYLIEHFATSSEAVTDRRFIGHDGRQASKAGQHTLGVSQYEAAPGEAFTVDLVGLVEVESGGPVAAGVQIMTDNEGRAVHWDGRGVVAGRARSTVSDEGEMLLVLLHPN